MHIFHFKLLLCFRGIMFTNFLFAVLVQTNSNLNRFKFFFRDTDLCYDNIYNFQHSSVYHHHHCLCHNINCQRYHVGAGINCFWALQNVNQNFGMYGLFRARKTENTIEGNIGQADLARNSAQLVLVGMDTVHICNGGIHS